MILSIDIDILDTVDTDREQEVPNTGPDYDVDNDETFVPAGLEEWFFHPEDEDGDVAFGRMLERRAEAGTWFGRDDHEMEMF